MDNNHSKFCCRVCGLFQGEDHPPWGGNGECPSFDICVCCGTEFGYDDCFLDDVKRIREKWLKEGAKWRWPKEKPENWSLEEQMKNIPEEYK